MNCRVHWLVEFALVFLSSVLVLSAENKKADLKSFRMITQQPDGWVVEYVPRAIPYSAVEINGKQYMVFSGGATSEDQKEGSPQLPSDALTLGIPFGASLVVDLIEPVYDLAQNQLVAPSPIYRMTQEREAVAVYKEDAAIYSQDRFFPSRQVIVDPPCVLRQQRLATIRLAPYQYNPAKRTLRCLLKARIQIRLVPDTGNNTGFPQAAAPLNDPYFEEVYKSLMWNYDQARQWRRPIPRSVSLTGDPTRDWFETGKVYYRILVAEDGWYRITSFDLAAAGADLSQIDLGSLKIIWRGNEVPIYVLPDTTIEFYGLRNYGDSTYFDYYTDTSTYWLTWGGPQGLRFSPSPQPSGVAGLSIQSSLVTKHYEQNKAFYRGATDAEIIENGPFPGKGWVWQFLSPDGVFTSSFVLDNIDSLSRPFSTLRVWLFGSTSNVPPVSHKAMFWMNDSLVGEISFGQRTGALFNATFPTRWLRNGSNTVTIKSIDTQTSPNQFYVDWFEIDYQGFLNATDDQLFFSSPATSGTSPVVFTVTGFSNPQIDVFDLTGNRKIESGTITGSQATGYIIVFNDTLSSPRKYMVVSSSGARPVLPPTSKLFSDIRANPQGADYIIITHKNFLRSAQQLAAHRQSVNRVRTKVVIVDDIYDEFNYGVFNAEAIKSFLKYAYQNWTPPAPTYVLLFGDACRDFHHFVPTNPKLNYVPSYGIPESDNWFGCFDSVYTFLPSLLIGRLSVEDSIQAQSVVAKVIGYDSYQLGDWNKSYLAITGGLTTGEQATLNAVSEDMINTYLTPHPLGGTAYRVYKTSTDPIDESKQQELKDLVMDGLVFINFLGHSGGRVWSLDIGDPNNLENTNGSLPFVASASCNIGAFADGFANVLSEDFLRADNRGAIAVWAGSSLGYANYGQALSDYFLSGVKDDSVRDFGALTTTARYKLWQASGSSYIIIAEVKLTPLIGDPLSRLAVPLEPDLAISSDDLSINKSVPTATDSSLTIRATIHNYGLVPNDSVGVTVADVFEGQSTYLLENKKLAPTLQRDSLFVLWKIYGRVGKHTLTMSLDPNNVINEVNKSNNTASIDLYVYANLLAVEKPTNNMVVQPDPQTLVVTTPIGVDSRDFQYFFQLDTLDTFDSPFLVESPAIVPGPVAAQWTTPSLAPDRVYFWRARTKQGAVLGNWVTSSFSTASIAPALPTLRLREYSKKQFARELLDHTMATDSGAIIATSPPVQLYSRSVGNRYDRSREFYSLLKVNDQTMSGYWWIFGNSFMAVRLNNLTGEYEFKGFNVAGQASQADSLKNFIKTTPAANYIAIAVILDGQTNVGESLYVAIESLGSNQIRSVSNGDSWALIAQKGTGFVQESYSKDGVAELSYLVPSSYVAQTGTVTSGDIGPARRWRSVSWANDASMAGTDLSLKVLGTKSGDVIDTILVLPKSVLSADLATVDPRTYPVLRLLATLHSDLGTATPILKSWAVEYDGTPDPAIAPQLFRAAEDSVLEGEPMQLLADIYNVGYSTADSLKVNFYIQNQTSARDLFQSFTLYNLEPDKFQTATSTLNTAGRRGSQALIVELDPGNLEELYAFNDVVTRTFYIRRDSTPPQLQTTFDGVQIVNGDYVSANPTILMKLFDNSPLPFQDTSNVSLRLDNVSIAYLNNPQLTYSFPSTGSEKAELEYQPQLSDGGHTLFIDAQDASGNPLSGSGFRIDFSVRNAPTLQDVYNYPNPFSNDTYFTFNLTGSTLPDELKIRIYTVAGRLIHTLLVPPNLLRFGFNRFYWDGRDHDGNEIANGVYFYTMVLKSGDKTFNVTERLAKVR
jgi:hypothetical protein